MPDTSSGGHVLNLTRSDDAPVTHRILVLKRTTQDIRDDFHVPVRMSSESHTRADPILIDDTQAMEAHPGRIMVFAKTKRVMAFKPSVLGVSSIGGLSNMIHTNKMDDDAQIGKDRVSWLTITKMHRYGHGTSPSALFSPVVARENVSKAALELQVSQPAVSRQIRDLEAELGFPLFEKRGKVFELICSRTNLSKRELRS